MWSPRVRARGSRLGGWAVSATDMSAHALTGTRTPIPRVVAFSVVRTVSRRVARQFKPLCLNLFFARRPVCADARLWRQSRGADTKLSKRQSCADVPPPKFGRGGARLYAYFRGSSWGVTDQSGRTPPEPARIVQRCASGSRSVRFLSLNSTRLITLSKLVV